MELYLNIHYLELLSYGALGFSRGFLGCGSKVEELEFKLKARGSYRIKNGLKNCLFLGPKIFLLLGFGFKN